MEISTDICWNSKFRKPKVKMIEKEWKFNEKYTHPIKKQRAQGSFQTVFTLGTKQEPKQSYTSFAQEKHLQTSCVNNREPSKEKTEKTSNISVLHECDFKVPICLQPCSSTSRTCINICDPPPPECLQKKIESQSCSSMSCPENKMKDPKYKAKFCPSCTSDKNACCEGPRPKRVKVKGARSKSTAPVGVLTQNAKSNCCKCCCLLAEYFKEVYRLFSLKDDSRISQIFCELLDVAGCLCHDCFNFLKKFLGFLVVYKK